MYSARVFPIPVAIRGENKSAKSSMCASGGAWRDPENLITGHTPESSMT